MDLIITVDSEIISEVKQGPFLSDHCALCFTTKFTSEHMRKTEMKTIRNLKDVRASDLIQIDDIDLNETDLDQLLQDVEDRVLNRLNEIAPEKTIRVTSRKKKPWFNKTLKNKKKEVRRKERVWRRTKSRNDWNQYRTILDEYKTMLGKAKSEQTKSLISECGNNTKKMFDVVNQLTNSVSTNPLPPETNSENATAFAKFFQTKISKIRDALSNHKKYEPPARDVPPLTTFSEVTSETIRKIVMRLKNKTCELDIIPTKMLKDDLPAMLDIITEIINISIKTSSFPHRWKISIVRPLLKTRGADLVHSNYRPVSNLPFLSKVLECVILDQINDHCTRYSLMPIYQSAYRQYFSCETALIKLLDDILWNMEKRKITLMICIDLSAAFDTVDHEVLCAVMANQFGITKSALEWVISYLKPRGFKVKCGDNYSSVNDLHFSVPQGSCAGPSFYSMYASTLQYTIPDDVNIYGYADDHALLDAYVTDIPASENACVRKLEKTLTDINEWMNQNRLKMNNEKTEFIAFGSRQNLAKVTSATITVKDVSVPRSSNVRYLGSILDSELNLKKHIGLKTKKAMFNLYKIRNIRQHLEQNVAAKLALSLVISHLDYANGILMGLPKCTLRPLQKVQNMAARVVLGNAATQSATENLRTLHWLPISVRIDFKLLTLVFKCLKGEAPSYLINLLKNKTSTRDGLRARKNTSFQLEVPFTRRSTFADRSFSVYAPKLWNTLPDELKTIQTTDMFKKHLKTYLFRIHFNSS